MAVLQKMLCSIRLQDVLFTFKSCLLTGLIFLRYVVKAELSQLTLGLEFSQWFVTYYGKELTCAAPYVSSKFHNSYFQLIKKKLEKLTSWYLLHTPTNISLFITFKTIKFLLDFYQGRSISSLKTNFEGNCLLRGCDLTNMTELFRLNFCTEYKER